MNLASFIYKMLRFHIWFALCAVLFVGCLETRMVSFKNLVKPLPSPKPRVLWKAEVDEILARYDASPTFSYPDERMQPLFGGITTLVYYGADIGQKLLDQRIPADFRKSGVELASACDSNTMTFPSTTSTVATDELTPDVQSDESPTFQPIWFPLSIDGGSLAPDARCDATGTPQGPDATKHFCLFGRLALQRQAGRPLIVVVHGIFDSSAQEYVRRLGAVLFAQGQSVLLPDMRDHGNTFRTNLRVPASLGNLEGADLLHLVQAVRNACGPRVGRAGAIGVSGGGLAAIRAYTLDTTNQLDAGVIAISPLIDINAAIRNLDTGSTCAITNAVELTWPDHLTIAAAGAVATFGGAAIAQSLDGQGPDEKSAIAAGIGALAGLATSLLVDAVFDGDSALDNDCVSRASVASLFSGMLRERWRTLRTRKEPDVLSTRGRSIKPDQVSLEDYLKERSEPFYAKLGKRMQRYDARALARDLRARSAGGRLLVFGAIDDPVTRAPALHELANGTKHLSHVHVRVVQYGGHGAMWIVNQFLIQRLFARFFDSTIPRSASDQAQEPVAPADASEVIKESGMPPNDFRPYGPQGTGVLAPQ